MNCAGGSGMLPSKANGGWASAETCGTGRDTCWALLPPAAQRRGGQGAVQAGVAWRGGALAPPPSLTWPCSHSQNDGPCPLLERDHGSWPQEERLVLRVPRCVPPLVGHGVLPSSLRPRLSWFQFGDRFFCKVSRTYGRGRDISRVISHFTAKN